MKSTHKLLKELIPRKQNQPGRVIGRTDGNKLIVRGASGQRKIIPNATGRYMQLGAAVLVSNTGSDQAVIGSDGVRDEIKIVYIKG